MRSLITAVTGKWERVFRRVWQWTYRMPKWAVYLVIYCYAAFAPIPNDILLAILALSSFRYREFAAYLFLGDITMTLILTTLFGGIA
jgi:uncharacterized membrane protein YdjX (TVP38/TMEM64 family)